MKYFSKITLGLILVRGSYPRARMMMKWESMALR